MKDLTQKQNEVLQFIKGYIAKNKYPPSIREVADFFGISVKGAHDHIRALEKKEHIRIGQNRSRAIEILDERVQHETLVEVPLLGRVAAGIPLFAEENFDGTLSIPRQMLGSGNHFALKVQGDSMIGAGILSGDTAVIRQQNTAENGDIVVAQVEEAVTLKRFFKEANRIRLQAENEAFKPLFAQNVKVLGKLVTIMRNYGR